MAAKDGNGVVVVRVPGGTIHLVGNRASGGQWAHGLETIESGNWELFPNVGTALDSGYQLCRSCFYSWPWINTPRPGST